MRFGGPALTRHQVTTLDDRLMHFSSTRVLSRDHVPVLLSNVLPTS